MTMLVTVTVSQSSKVRPIHHGLNYQGANEFKEARNKPGCDGKAEAEGRCGATEAAGDAVACSPRCRSGVGLGKGREGNGGGGSCYSSGRRRVRRLRDRVGVGVGGGWEARRRPENLATRWDV